MKNTTLGPARRVLAVASALLIAAGLSGHVVAQTPSPPPVVEFVPGELLVRVTDANTAAKLAQLLSTLGGVAVERFETVDGLYLIRLPDTLSVTSAGDLARQLDGIAYAEPNYILRTQAVPDDPNFVSGELWGLHNTGQSGGTADADIDAPEAWDITTGSSDVVVAVIDTGIDYTHPDLSANMFRNEADCNANGVDDEGNGFIDDCHGINTVNTERDPLDDHNHGTHVAGTIGGVGNNGVGVTGVNWNVRMMACKFLNAAGSGSTAGAVSCLNYIALMKDRGVNIIATNNSWGGGGFSQALYDAIEGQRQRGILFIAAAGNSNTDTDATPGYPAGYDVPNVIAVAATTRTDARSSFSSFGRRTVHLGAPGSAIVSTTRNNTYASFNGTSMATPHVTGVAALLKAQDPSRDWRAIRNLLLAGGDSIASLSTNTITGRRLNAAGSLTCSNTTVFSRLKPAQSTVSTSVGSAITLSALSINCAAPTAGTLTVAVSGAAAVTLRDDGAAPDQAAGDGIFVGSFVPASVPSGGQFVLTFPNAETVTVQVTSNTLYSFRSVSSSFRQITGTSLGLGDDSSTPVTPPFPLLFAGSSFSSVFVSSNGNLNFASAFNVYANVALPTNQHSGPLIAPLWDDLLPTSSNPARNVVWAVTGTAPGRELVIEWRDITGFGCDPATEQITFQVVLFEGQGDILFNYADAHFGGSCALRDRGASATVGVQSSPTAATQFSLNADNLADGLSLLWTYGVPATSTFTDDPLSAGATLVKAVHINELRTRIDALRTRFALPPVSWTDPTIAAGVTPVRAQHLTQMRTAVTEVYQVANVTPPAFTNQTVQPGELPIRAQHIAELRSAVVTLEGTQSGR
jgi:subtilisin family serine protease